MSEDIGNTFSGYPRMTKSRSSSVASSKVAVGIAHDDRGTDVFLHLVDSGFDPAAATGETLVVRTLCTNRDLPTRLPRIGEEVRFHLGFAAPGVSARSVRNPTGSLRPASPRGRSRIAESPRRPLLRYR